jgi:CheY-like chemotaxis protein
MDLHLPGMDGYEATARLRQEPRLDDVAIIAVTAMAMVGDRGDILQAGFDGYFSKPLSPESFIREIGAFL